MVGNWVLRFVKGIFIGSGFILPGVSGGALAAVFGIYEHIISFLAHPTRNFEKNVRFLFPVGLGGFAGLVIFSFAVSFFLGHYEKFILWLFIGCILGTFPALWKQAGLQGRRKRHYGILAASFALALNFLLFGEKLFAGGVPQNFATWLLAGALVALGVLVPGLSPSNFLIYMDMYKPMADGIMHFDLMVILPLALGAVACMLLLSKAVDYLFRKAYAGLFHCILGVVLASTLMIVPREAQYTGPGILLCLLLCAAGAVLGLWMSHLEEKYKPQEKKPA